MDPTDSHPPPPLSDRFTRALELARAAHEGQPRKGTRTPYLAHPLAVCAIVLEHGAEEDEAIAALLHDVAEDAGGREALDGIRREFGPRVAGIVRGCSDHVAEPGEIGGPKPEWRARKAAYIEHLRTADASTRLVVAADKLHNARSIRDDYRDFGGVVWKRFKAGPRDTLGYYHSAVAALASPSPPGQSPAPATSMEGPADTPYDRLLDKLRRVVEDLDRMVRADESGG